MITGMRKFPCYGLAWLEPLTLFSNWYVVADALDSISVIVTPLFPLVVSIFSLSPLRNFQESPVAGPFNVIFLIDTLSRATKMFFFFHPFARYKGDTWPTSLTSFSNWHAVSDTFDSIFVIIVFSFRLLFFFFHPLTLFKGDTWPNSLTLFYNWHVVTNRFDSSFVTIFCLFFSSNIILFLSPLRTLHCVKAGRKFAYLIVAV